MSASGGGMSLLDRARQIWEKSREQLKEAKKEADFLLNYEDRQPSSMESSQSNAAIPRLLRAKLAMVEMRGGHKANDSNPDSMPRPNMLAALDECLLPISLAELRHPLMRSSSALCLRLEALRLRAINATGEQILEKAEHFSKYAGQALMQLKDFRSWSISGSDAWLDPADEAIDVRTPESWEAVQGQDKAERLLARSQLVKVFKDLADAHRDKVLKTHEPNPEKTGRSVGKISASAQREMEQNRKDEKAMGMKATSARRKEQIAVQDQSRNAELARQKRESIEKVKAFVNRRMSSEPTGSDSRVQLLQQLLQAKVVDLEVLAKEQAKEQAKESFREVAQLVPRLHKQLAHFRETGRWVYWAFPLPEEEGQEPNQGAGKAGKQPEKVFPHMADFIHYLGETVLKDDVPNSLVIDGCIDDLQQRHTDFDTSRRHPMNGDVLPTMYQAWRGDLNNWLSSLGQITGKLGYTIGAYRETGCAFELTPDCVLEMYRGMVDKFAVPSECYSFYDDDANQLELQMRVLLDGYLLLLNHRGTLPLSEEAYLSLGDSKDDQLLRVCHRFMAEADLLSKDGYLSIFLKENSHVLCHLQAEHIFRNLRSNFMELDPAGPLGPQGATDAANQLYSQLHAKWVDECADLLDVIRENAAVTPALDWTLSVVFDQHIGEWKEHTGNRNVSNVDIIRRPSAVKFLLGRLSLANANLMLSLRETLLQTAGQVRHFATSMLAKDEASWESMQCCLEFASRGEAGSSSSSKPTSTSKSAPAKGAKGERGAADDSSAATVDSPSQLPITFSRKIYKFACDFARERLKFVADNVFSPEDGESNESFIDIAELECRQERALLTDEAQKICMPGTMEGEAALVELLWEEPSELPNTQQNAWPLAAAHLQSLSLMSHIFKMLSSQYVLVDQLRQHSEDCWLVLQNERSRMQRRMKLENEFKDVTPELSQHMEELEGGDTDSEVESHLIKAFEAFTDGLKELNKKRFEAEMQAKLRAGRTITDRLFLYHEQIEECKKALKPLDMRMAKLKGSEAAEKSQRMCAQKAFKDQLLSMLKHHSRQYEEARSELEKEVDTIMENQEVRLRQLEDVSRPFKKQQISDKDLLRARVRGLEVMKSSERMLFEIAAQIERNHMDARTRVVLHLCYEPTFLVGGPLIDMPNLCTLLWRQKLLDAMYKDAANSVLDELWDEGDVGGANSKSAAAAGKKKKKKQCGGGAAKAVNKAAKTITEEEEEEEGEEEGGGKAVTSPIAVTSPKAPQDGDEEVVVDGKRYLLMDGGVKILIEDEIDYKPPPKSADVTAAAAPEEVAGPGDVGQEGEVLSQEQAQERALWKLGLRDTEQLVNEHAGLLGEFTTLVEKFMAPQQPPPPPRPPPPPQSQQQSRQQLHMPPPSTDAMGQQHQQHGRQQQQQQGQQGANAPRLDPLASAWNPLAEHGGRGAVRGRGDMGGGGRGTGGDAPRPGKQQGREGNDGGGGDGGYAGRMGSGGGDTGRKGSGGRMQEGAGSAGTGTNADPGGGAGGRTQSVSYGAGAGGTDRQAQVVGGDGGGGGSRMNMEDVNGGGGRGSRFKGRRRGGRGADGPDGTRDGRDGAAGPREGRDGRDGAAGPREGRDGRDGVTGPRENRDRGAATSARPLSKREKDQEQRELTRRSREEAGSSRMEYGSARKQQEADRESNNTANRAQQAGGVDEGERNRDRFSSQVHAQRDGGVPPLSQRRLPLPTGTAVVLPFDQHAALLVVSSPPPLSSSSSPYPSEALQLEQFPPLPSSRGTASEALPTEAMQSSSDMRASGLSMQGTGFMATEVPHGWRTGVSDMDRSSGLRSNDDEVVLPPKRHDPILNSLQPNSKTLSDSAGLAAPPGLGVLTDNSVPPGFSHMGRFPSLDDGMPSQQDLDEALSGSQLAPQPFPQNSLDEAMYQMSPSEGSHALDGAYHMPPVASEGLYQMPPVESMYQMPQGDGSMAVDGCGWEASRVSSAMQPPGMYGAQQQSDIRTSNIVGLMQGTHLGPRPLNPQSIPLPQTLPMPGLMQMPPSGSSFVPHGFVPPYHHVSGGGTGQDGEQWGGGGAEKSEDEDEEGGLDDLMNLCGVNPAPPSIHSGWQHGGALYQSQQAEYPGGQNSGYTGQDSGYPGQDSGYIGQDSGYQGQDSGYQGHDTGYQGQDSGYQGQDSGYQGQDSGYQGHISEYPAPDSGYPEPDSGGYQGQEAEYPGPEAGLEPGGPEQQGRFGEESNSGGAEEHHVQSWGGADEQAHEQQAQQQHPDSSRSGTGSASAWLQPLRTAAPSNEGGAVSTSDFPSLGMAQESSKPKAWAAIVAKPKSVSPPAPVTVAPEPVNDEDDEELQRALRESLQMQSAPAMSGGSGSSPAQQRPLSSPEPPRSSGPGSSLPLASGMVNRSGEYNCFLNVIIQCLWHCERFRLKLSHLNPERSKRYPVVSSMIKLFHNLDQAQVQWKPGQERAAIDPTELREALDALPNYEFRLGEMSDPSEVLSAIYECFAVVPDLLYKWANHPMIVDVFGMEVSEELRCACGVVSHKVAHHVEYAHIIQATSLRAIHQAEKGSMGHKIHLVDSQQTKKCDKDMQGCNLPGVPQKNLHYAPWVFTLLLAWEPNVSSDDIAATMDAIDMEVDMVQVFGGKVPPAREGDLRSKYLLQSMFCYYGQHYHAFVFRSDIRKWVVFDDMHVAPVGQWKDVINKCTLGRIQPSVLFYTRAEHGFRG